MHNIWAQICIMYIFKWQDNKDNIHGYLKNPSHNIQEHASSFRSHHTVYEWNEYYSEKMCNLEFWQRRRRSRRKTYEFFKKIDSEAETLETFARLFLPSWLSRKFSEKLNMNWVYWKWMEAFGILGMHIAYITLHTYFTICEKSQDRVAQTRALYGYRVSSTLWTKFCCCRLIIMHDILSHQTKKENDY